MLSKLNALRSEFEDIQRSLQDPEIFQNPKELARLGKRSAELQPLMELLDDYETCQKIITDSAHAENDPELRAMALEEAESASEKMKSLEAQMKIFLVPMDPLDDRNAILEVRAGTGGDEAALFAAELVRMYIRFAETQGWKTELVDKTDAGAGGVKEAVLRVEGSGAFGSLRFEAGVHRVQRIPETENKGRVHTSTATVAVLPEAEEVDVPIRTEDLRIDTYRASGAGGQHVNKTESAVRITHVPTETVVACQSERSQLQNKAKAMELLRSKIFEVQREKQAKESGDMRSIQVGSGDRSEKIRTYNFPQDRLTDHRINENFHNLPKIMEGELRDIVEKLKLRYQEEMLQYE